jgi:hypothetical protein
MVNKLNMARAVAPEDIRPGCYVTILKKVDEWVRWTDCISGESWKGSAPSVARVLITPDEEPSVMKVEEICLPLIFVRTSKMRCRLIDVRTVRLAAVSESFGRKVFKRQSTTPSE